MYQIKDLIGQIPFAADLYDMLQKQPPRTRFNLRQLDQFADDQLTTLKAIPADPDKNKHILLFATLHYWIEQAAVIAVVLQKLGYKVTVAYLPYSSWDKPVNKLDLKRQDLYAARVLKKFSQFFDTVSLLRVKPSGTLPPGFNAKIQLAASYDTMYTLQVEDFDPHTELYQLRLQRNEAAARQVFGLFAKTKPDIVLIPNGLVTELGVWFQASKHLGLDTVTYEFNDQREQIWISHTDVVMNQNTDEIWAAKKDTPLDEEQYSQIAAFEDARSSAKKFGKGTRFWQDVASVGGQAQRQALGLDDRPVVLLATNVLGDSLTLGRNIFTASMAEWIAKTVVYYSQHPQAQLVVRIHPGERLMKGPSSIDVINHSLPSIPENIKIIGPLEKVNTYDLMEIADLGLVYTTTVGLEMAMRGVPVIVAGKTHYRGRGFTYDPANYEDNFAITAQLLENTASKRLSQTQIDTAWNYAYRFFFEYPRPFPWRLMKFWEDLQEWPIQRILSPEGRGSFTKTFSALAGEPIDW